MKYLSAFRVPGIFGRTQGSLYDVGDGTYEFGFSDRLSPFMRQEITVDDATRKVLRSRYRGLLEIEPEGDPGNGKGKISVGLRTVFGNTYTGIVEYDRYEWNNVMRTRFNVTCEGGVRKICSDGGKLISSRTHDILRFDRAVERVIHDNYDAIRLGLPASAFAEYFFFN